MQRGLGCFSDTKELALKKEKIISQSAWAAKISSPHNKCDLNDHAFVRTKIGGWGLVERQSDWRLVNDSQVMSEAARLRRADRRDWVFGQQGGKIKKGEVTISRVLVCGSTGGGGWMDLNK